MAKNPASGFKLEGKVTYGNPFNIFLQPEFDYVVRSTNYRRHFDIFINT